MLLSRNSTLNVLVYSCTFKSNIRYMDIFYSDNSKNEPDEQPDEKVKKKKKKKDKERDRENEQ